MNRRKTGAEELALGELKFYQGDSHAAETLIIRALEQAREYKQYEIIYLALFYMLRISIAQGNYSKVQLALKGMKIKTENYEYAKIFLSYDITLCWYYCILDLPEKTPGWLKGNFSPYRHTAFIENFGNQMKALYCYKTRNYPPLLSYIHEKKSRESFLFERIEMLALEACINYKLKNKNAAFNALQQAYKTAIPNNIIIPFIELGKDMRTLTAAALKEGRIKIPKAWLENINRKTATYAKRQAHVITEYRQANHMADTVDLSPREADILTDLSHGLSRSEIADSRGLSINTVKMVISNVYMKLGAEHLADLIRIAAERELI
jgi:LuxR family maltose regulon positive regulatory protein